MSFHQRRRSSSNCLPLVVLSSVVACLVSSIGGWHAAFGSILPCEDWRKTKVRKHNRIMLAVVADAAADAEARQSKQDEDDDKELEAEVLAFKEKRRREMQMFREQEAGAEPRADRPTIPQAVDVEDDRWSRMAVLQVSGADDAVAAFTQKFPQVMSKAQPNYLGNPCGEPELRANFQALGLTIGRDEALDLVREEPLLLAMLPENLKSSWEAMLNDVARGDRNAALRVVRRRPTCLIAPADEFAGKTLKEFDAVSDATDAFKPVTDTLRDIGPEGVALGAAAFGVAALGALASKVAKDKARQGNISGAAAASKSVQKPRDGAEIKT